MSQTRAFSLMIHYERPFQVSGRERPLESFLLQVAVLTHLGSINAFRFVRFGSLGTYNYHFQYHYHSDPGPWYTLQPFAGSHFE